MHFTGRTPAFQMVALDLGGPVGRGINGDHRRPPFRRGPATRGGDRRSSVSAGGPEPVGARGPTRSSGGSSPRGASSGARKGGRRGTYSGPAHGGPSSVGDDRCWHQHPSSSRASRETTGRADGVTRVAVCRDDAKAPASESMVAAGIHSPALRARIRLARIFVAGVIGEGKWRRSPDKGDDAPKSHGVHLAVGWRHGSAASSVRAAAPPPRAGSRRSVPTARCASRDASCRGLSLRRQRQRPGDRNGQRRDPQPSTATPSDASFAAARPHSNQGPSPSVVSDLLALPRHETDPEIEGSLTLSPLCADGASGISAPRFGPTTRMALA